MAVAVVFAPVVVGASAGGGGQGGECPHIADRGQAAVLHSAVDHGVVASAGAGDGGGAGVGLQCPGVGEAAAVVTDFAEQSGAGQVSEAGEAGDDGVVGVGAEGGDGCVLQGGGSGAGGVEDGQQG